MINIILFLVKIIQLDHGELWFIEWIYDCANFIMRGERSTIPLHHRPGCWLHSWLMHQVYYNNWYILWGLVITGGFFIISLW